MSCLLPRVYACKSIYLSYFFFFTTELAYIILSTICNVSIAIKRYNYMHKRKIYLSVLRMVIITTKSILRTYVNHLGLSQSFSFIMDHGRSKLIYRLNHAELSLQINRNAIIGLPRNYFTTLVFFIAD